MLPDKPDLPVIIDPGTHIPHTSGVSPIWALKTRMTHADTLLVHLLRFIRRRIPRDMRRRMYLDDQPGSPWLLVVNYLYHIPYIPNLRNISMTLS
jgi:hypothetical protein